VQRSDEPSLDELPEHAQGLIKTEIDQADDDELTALGLNRPTRRLYRHWTEKLTYAGTHRLHLSLRDHQT
jgi:hypothetical protein